MNNIEEFKKELTNLINKYNIESGSNTPDFIICEYLINCLLTFNSIQKNREKWYGRELDVAQTNVPDIKPTPNPDTIRIGGGSSITEKYLQAGGIPIKERYSDEMKKRTQES
jgi:hypothetical protein